MTNVVLRHDSLLRLGMTADSVVTKEERRQRAKELKKPEEKKKKKKAPTSESDEDITCLWTKHEFNQTVVCFA